MFKMELVTKAQNEVVHLCSLTRTFDVRKHKDGSILRLGSTTRHVAPLGSCV